MPLFEISWLENVRVSYIHQGIEKLLKNAYVEVCWGWRWAKSDTARSVPMSSHSSVLMTTSIHVSVIFVDEWICDRTRTCSSSDISADGVEAYEGHEQGRGGVGMWHTTDQWHCLVRISNSFCSHVISNSRWRAIRFRHQTAHELWRLLP